MTKCRKVYLGTSFRSLELARDAANRLCGEGHKVHRWWIGEDGHESTSDLSGLLSQDPRQFRLDETANAVAQRNLEGIRWADVFVLIRPCGDSSHHEMGIAETLGKPCFVFDPAWETGLQEIAYVALHATDIVQTIDELVAALARPIRHRAGASAHIGSRGLLSLTTQHFFSPLQRVARFRQKCVPIRIVTEAPSVAAADGGERLPHQPLP